MNKRRRKSCKNLFYFFLHFPFISIFFGVLAIQEEKKLESHIEPKKKGKKKKRKKKKKKEEKKKRGGVQAREPLTRDLLSSDSMEVRRDWRSRMVCLYPLFSEARQSTWSWSS